MRVLRFADYYSPMQEPAAASSSWTFLTNYAHVLLAIVDDPGIRIRDIAARVGITERAAQRIVRELLTEGYLDARKVGRRNTYSVNAERPLRHPMEEGRTVGQLIALLQQEPGRGG